ncbi:MAG: hypothetical protein MUC97_13275 [Bernardetiaceae bacterium]|nr:hypothetical protein [Bernardetiaceae bacterium]
MVAFIMLIDFGVSYLYIKPPKPSPIDNLRSPHPYYHHTFLPLRDTLEAWGSEHYAIRTNHLGLKDAAPRQVPLVADKPRLLLIGDSFTEGIGLPFEQTFAGIMRDSLPHLDLLNAGVVSYCPKLDYLKVQFLLDQIGLKVDKVLMLIDISDINNEIIYKNFIPALTKQAAQSGHRPAAPAIQSTIWQHLKNEVLDFLDKYSTIGHFVLNYKPPEPPPANDQAAKGNSPIARWTFDPQAMNDWGKEGLALAQQNAQLMANFCRQKGIELTLVVYPWPDQIRQRELASPQVQIWQAFAQKNQLRFVNLFPDFIDNGLDAEQTYRQYFIQGDVHWNFAGNQIVARKLISFYK